MGKSDIDIIDVDLQKFFNDSEVCLTKTGQCIIDFSEFLANLLSIKLNLDSATEELKGLTKVQGYSLAKFDDDLISRSSEISDALTEKIARMTAYFALAQEYITSYNEGNATFNNELWDVLQSDESILGKIGNTATSMGLWEVIDAFLKTFNNPVISAVTNLFVYGTDITQEGGNFAVGDAVNKGVQSLIESVYGENAVKLIKSSGTISGMIAAGLLTYGLDRLSDNGEWSDLDKSRAWLDVGSSVFSYGEWALITSAIGGPWGVLVASAAGFVSNIVLGDLCDCIVGDNVVDEILIGYDENGEEIMLPVYKNGNGPDGTFELIQEKYESLVSETFEYQGRTMSYTNYKNMLYGDFQGTYEGSKTYEITPFTDYDYENCCDCLLPSIANASTLEEATFIFENASQYTDLTILVYGLGFDATEYFNYTHYGNIYGYSG